jgi:hypothetical protein
LDKISNDKTLKIKERLDKIRKEFEDPLFTKNAQIILAHKQVDTFSFTYLKMCFFSLLEALGLYTPTRQKLLNEINDAVKNPPPLGELTKRFGLFATASKEVETKRYEAPVMPIATP